MPDIAQQLVRARQPGLLRRECLTQLLAKQQIVHLPVQTGPECGQFGQPCVYAFRCLLLRPESI